METFESHRFLDEAGDTTFYGKGKIPILGTEGVSNSFIIGMVKFNEPLKNIREKIIELQKSVETDKYYKAIPSIEKKKAKNGFYFHDKDDIPEVRKQFFEFINTIDCSFQAVVGRKSVQLFERKHNGKSNEFYADLLSHLIKDNLTKYEKLVLKIAKRESSTANKNLDLALKKATNRFSEKYPKKEIKTNVLFDVQNQYSEPLLNISDYFCWAIQRVFERREIRYYEFLKEKISIVIDLYDSSKYKNSKNYYTLKNPLTELNKISPPLS